MALSTSRSVITVEPNGSSRWHGHGNRYIALASSWAYLILWLLLIVIFVVEVGMSLTDMVCLNVLINCFVCYCVHSHVRVIRSNYDAYASFYMFRFSSSYLFSSLIVLFQAICAARAAACASSSNCFYKSALLLPLLLKLPPLSAAADEDDMFYAAALLLSLPLFCIFVLLLFLFFFFFFIDANNAIISYFSLFCWTRKAYNDMVTRFYNYTRSYYSRKHNSRLRSSQIGGCVKCTLPP